MQAFPVPREQWDGVFGSMGLPAVTIGGDYEMLEGVNSGHVAFAGGYRVIRGSTTLAEALRSMLPAIHH